MANISLNIRELKEDNGQLVIITHKNDLPIIYHLASEGASENKSIKFELHHSTVVTMEGFEFRFNNYGFLKVTYRGSLLCHEPDIEWFNENQSLIKDSLNRDELEDFLTKYIDLYDSTNTCTKITMLFIIAIPAVLYFVW
jgi:hypothetical protein